MHLSAHVVSLLKNSIILKFGFLTMPTGGKGFPKPKNMNVLKASKFLFLIALVAFTTWACDQKDDATPEQNEIVGKWKLDKITGGFSGSGYTADWNTLELNANLTYRRLQNETLRYQGTYELVKKDGKTFINFKESATPSNAPFESDDKEVTLEKDKFILSDPCCDLFQYEFSKANQ